MRETGTTNRSRRGFRGPLAAWPRWRKWLLSTAVLVAALVGAIALEVHRDGAYFFVACDLGRLQPHALGRASFLYSSDGVRFATVGAPVVRRLGGWAWAGPRVDVRNRPRGDGPARRGTRSVDRGQEAAGGAVDT